MSSLIFFGQGGELFMGEDGTAEERLKSLLGDSSDRGGLARRRIVRRPLSGYQAQSMLFSERDAASSLAAGDPLSEMFMHLAATRKEQSSGRTGNGEPSISASVMSGLAQLGTEESFGNRIPHAKESSSALTQLRSRFVQEMMLSALTDESTLSQSVRELHACYQEYFLDSYGYAVHGGLARVSGLALATIGIDSS